MQNRPLQKNQKVIKLDLTSLRVVRVFRKDVILMSFCAKCIFDSFLMCQELTLVLTARKQLICHSVTKVDPKWMNGLKWTYIAV